jgi:hypothetical protein
MMKQGAAIAVIALLLAGCWQSRGTLYAGAVPIMPFHDGRVIERDDQKKIQHFTLRLDSSGTYRLVGDDKGSDGYGEGFGLRFFPLAGASHGALLYEAVALDDCVKGTKLCGEANDDGQRYYGVVLPGRDGAEEIRPDCAKDAAVTKKLGVKDDGGGTCTFKNRATLEKALRQLAKSKKPAFSYTLQ